MIVQFVEGVKELFRVRSLIAQQLDIVHQQYVGLAIALVKLLHPLRVGMQEIISFMKRSRGGINDPHRAVPGRSVPADGGASDGSCPSPRRHIKTGL